MNTYTDEIKPPVYSTYTFEILILQLFVTYF